MALEKIGEYEIPSYAVTYLEYWDDSGIDEQDKENIDNWLKREFDGFTGLVFDWSDSDPSFTWNPEFGLACDVIDCTVYGHRG